MPIDGCVGARVVSRVAVTHFGHYYGDLPPLAEEEIAKERRAANTGGGGRVALSDPGLAVSGWLQRTGIYTPPSSASESRATRHRDSQRLIHHRRSRLDGSQWGALQRSNSHLQTGLECAQPHALPERQWVSVYPHLSNQWRVKPTPLTGSALGCAKAASSPSTEPAPIRHGSIRATAASNISVSAARGYRLSDTRAMALAVRDVIGRHEDKTLNLRKVHWTDD